MASCQRAGPGVGRSSRARCSRASLPAASPSHAVYKGWTSSASTKIATKAQYVLVTAALQQRQQKQQQQPQPGPAGSPQPASLSRSAALRLALLSTTTAAAAASSGGWGSLLAAPPAASAASITLPPLQPLAASLAAGSGGGGGPPRSSLVLADPQLLPLQPGPIPFPRRQLELNFAVLLMRSGYDAVDDLDFIAMNDFQKSFWKLRQAEWEPYTLLNSPLRIQQGQLSDPLYFDFISFSQFAAASREMARGKQEFEEYDETSEGMRVVRRDPALADNSLLPARFYERMGDKVYGGLVEGFRGEEFGGPPPCLPGAPASELLAGVQRILDIFVAKGYALKATLTPTSTSSSLTTSLPNNDGSNSNSGDNYISTPAAPGPQPLSFTMQLQGSANLWGLQALASRRSVVYDAHDAMAVGAFLRASGRSSTCRLAWSDTGVSQQWTVA